MAYYVLRTRTTRAVLTTFLFNMLFFVYASSVVVAHGHAIQQAVRACNHHFVY